MNRSALWQRTGNEALVAIAIVMALVTACGGGDAPPLGDGAAADGQGLDFRVDRQRDSAGDVQGRDIRADLQRDSAGDVQGRDIRADLQRDSAGDALHDSLPVDLALPDAHPNACDTPNAIRPCPTGLYGVCAGGEQTCSVELIWSDCVPSFTPGGQAEICGSGEDEDCDGLADGDDPDCQACPPGANEACDSGLPGECGPGHRACVHQEEGGGWGWDSCKPDLLPGEQREVEGEATCSNLLDDDCDGLVDLADEDCRDCAPQETAACATGEPGVCNAGEKSCSDTGAWGPCVPDFAVGTQAETCGGDEDEDCDGLVDEDDPDCQSCTPEAKETCDTGLLGVCQSGERACVPQSSRWEWGACLATTLPGTQAEDCANGLDDDCDGAADHDDTDCCAPRAAQACVADDLFWFDSCDRQEGLIQDCGDDGCDAWGSWACSPSDQVRARTCHDRGCAGGACFDTTTTEVETVQCGDDSCGAWSAWECAADDRARTRSCHDRGCAGGACFDNAYTDTDTVDCGVDACDAWGAWTCVDDDQVRARTCYDRGCSAGACFENTTTDTDTVDCGVDGCVAWGAWTCAGSTARQQERICYNRGCSAGACYETALPVYTVTEPCSGSVCEIVDGEAACVDYTPSAFSFTDLVDQALSTVVSSNVITPTGFNTAVTVSVSGGTSSQVRQNGGGWTTSIAAFNPGDTLQVRTTTSSAWYTTSDVVVTVGLTSDTWSVRTVDIGGNDSNTVLLLHFDDTSFTDSSASAHTTNEFGGPTRAATPAKFGHAVCFDGNDRIEVPNHNDWCFGASPWTIDFWVYPATTGWTSLGEFGIDPSGTWSGDNSISWRLQSHPTEGAHFSAWSATISPNVISSSPYGVPANQWTHLAYVYNGSSLRIFINGTQRVNQAISGSFRCNTTYPMKLGMTTSNYSTSYFTGCLDELRISKGVARWTSNFSVPTRPYN